jgi:hypothetical protein
MRRLLMTTLAAGVALVAGAASAADPGDALRDKADACVRDNAARVVAVSPTPIDAVNFLVDAVCAQAIDRAHTYQNNARMLADWRARPVRPPMAIDPKRGPPSAFEQRELDDAARTTAQLADVSVDPQTGEMVTPPGFEPPIQLTSPLVLNLFTGMANQARYKTLAGQAVLAAEEAARKR